MCTLDLGNTIYWTSSERIQISHLPNLTALWRSVSWRRILRPTSEINFNTPTQSKLFSASDLPTLKKCAPYSSIFVNDIIFKGLERAARTSFLQCLSGSHFGSEHFCHKFKESRSRSCPFCENHSRDLSHYFFHCPKFSEARADLRGTIKKKLGYGKDSRIPPSRQIIISFWRRPADEPGLPTSG